MSVETSLNLLISESIKCNLDIKDIKSKSISDITNIIQKEVILYQEEIKKIKTILDQTSFEILRILSTMNAYNPPINHISNTEIYNRLELKFTSEQIEYGLNELISNNLISIKSLRKKEYNNYIYNSFTSIGYTVKDYFIALYFYYDDNKILPAWLKEWLRKSDTNLELDYYQKELISRIPNVGYLMSPMTRKLTCVRDKWHWIASERVSKNPNDGLEQVMYTLPDKEQEALKDLLQKNIITINTYHYGMPIYIPNPDYF
jgi:hypothetical protein